MDDLDNILNEGADLEQQPEVVEAPQEPVKDEGDQLTPKGDNEDAPPASDDKSKGLEAGISAERKKRQEAEQQLEALRRELEQRQPQEQQSPPPSIWEDDQAALGHVRDSAVSEAVQQATFNARLDMSEMMVRQTQPDFDDMKAEFLRLMQINPELQQQALSDPHPWQKAYNIAKNARAASELGATNIAELEAKLREQIMAEQARPAAPNLPTSLADAQSARGNNAPAPAPLTLEEILGR